MRCSTAAFAVVLSVAACGAPATSAPASSPSSPSARVQRIDAAPGMVVRRACTPTGPEVCFDARDDNCNGIIDEGCGVRTGLVQFAIAWDEPTTDVDLHVIDPNGELVEPGRLTASGLTKDRDCPGPREDCQGQNLENVFLEEGKELPRGRYRVRIRLEKLGDVEPPVRCTFGARVGPKSYAVELELQRVEEEGEIVFEL